MSNKSAKTPIPGVPEGGSNDKPAPSPTQYFSLRYVLILFSYEINTQLIIVYYFEIYFEIMILFCPHCFYSICKERVVLFKWEQVLNFNERIPKCKSYQTKIDIDFLKSHEIDI